MNERIPQTELESTSEGLPPATESKSSTDSAPSAARPQTQVQADLPGIGHPSIYGTLTQDPALAPKTIAIPWEPGWEFGDFLLLAVLGRGAFGTVYLAHQRSLDRRVALKVTNAGGTAKSEGVALAGLEHDHIVKVYSEFIEDDKHCLCLQYVPGTDLGTMLRELHQQGDRPNSGETLLRTLDQHVRGQAEFNPTSLRDREALAIDNFPQAVCRIGYQLARALNFAHSHDILHCDIKPANILVTPYGRPMLADFNVAFDRARLGPTVNAIGGTAHYMAPEHFAAVRGEANARQVDERCDIYSLGVVLFEFATGELPSEKSWEKAQKELPRELTSVIRKCLEADPENRYASAEELADALMAAWTLIGVQQSLPPLGRVGRWTNAHPLRGVALAALVPHGFASMLNIAYNSVEIQLNDPQQAMFMTFVVCYNLIVYPGVVVSGWLILTDVYRRLQQLPTATGDEVDRLRQRVLQFGWLVIGMGIIGWLPGGFLFPLGIHLFSEALPWQVFAHFAVSFTLSCLVGLVFSYFAVQLVVLRSLYPRLGNPDRFTPDLAKAELAPIVAPFGLFLLLATAVPLAGAILLVVLADEVMTLGFRVLVAGKIGMGVAGVSLANQMVNLLKRNTDVWDRLSGDRIGTSDHGRATTVVASLRTKSPRRGTDAAV